MTRARTVLLAAGALAWCACDGAPADAPARRFVLGDVSVEVPTPEASILREEPGRAVLAHEGVRVRLLSAPARGGAEALSNAAEGLVERYALGEQEGALTSRACRYAAEDARCLEGSFAHDGAQWVRRGALVRAGATLVWLDVVGPETVSDEVSLWNESLRERAVVMIH